MAETLARLFRHTVSYDKPDAVLTKSGGRYQPIASAELYRRVVRLHLGLRNVGIEAGDRCALLSENRWEWAVADFAMVTAGICTVPLYPTLSAEQLHYMLEHSEARVVFVSTQEQLDKILSQWPRLPKLEGAVAFNEVDCDDERVTCLSALIGGEPLTAEERDAFEAAVSAVRPDQLATIIYTSGTTGTPKGVMLTHENIASNVRDTGFDLRPSDVCLSFLPLSHVAERAADYAYFYNGASVAYPESLETVAENLAEVRPTVVLGVPRFFEKLYGRVMDAIAAAPRQRQRLFHWGVAVGREALPYRLEGKAMPARLRWRYLLADRLVFAKLRGRLGGRLRFFVSGAAPLAKHLAEFFYAAGVTICEAYGLTETSPLISTNLPGNLRFGTVGRPIRNIEVKLADDGEILVRGPNVMRGYYRMEEETAKTIVDGWLHTGDVGKLDADGYLSITDRKKDLFKTSGGKFIAPQPIENQLKACATISTAVVIAEARRFPSALIVPHFERLEKYAAEQGFPSLSRAELASHPEILKLVEREISEACADMAQYERVKKFVLLTEDFSIANGEITPTMKVRRRQVETRYAAEIEKLYRE
jgi:long-chain acyl-CoA synthetase